MTSARPTTAAQPFAHGAMRVVVARNAEELEQHVAAWDNLAGAAIEPNVFYESWHLLPAVRHFGAEFDLRFVLIYRQDDKSTEPLLCGFFPLERRNRCKGIPVTVLALWNHMYCSLCTPLLRRGHEVDCLETFFAWLQRDADGAPLLEMNDVSADGPFQQHWVDWSYRNAALIFADECHTRAVLHPTDNEDAYVRCALSSKRRKEFQRKSNRLSEQGKVEFRRLHHTDDVSQWTENFLTLESSGWKGREGTAFANNSEHGAFFREVAKGAFERGRLMLLALCIDERPIAMKFNLLAGEGAFACKIAFDEAFAQYSPGVLLELENIRQSHVTLGLRWMDSCAIADHSMINRLWTERRIIQSQIVSSGRKPGDLVVSLLPLLRWLNRKLRRSRATQAEPAPSEGHFED